MSDSNRVLFAAWLVGATILLLTFGTQPASATDEAANLPRYRLETGKHFVYEGETRSRYEVETGSRPSGTDNTRLWRRRSEYRVFGRNNDGSWRVLLTSNTTFFDSSGKSTHSRDSIHLINLFPDGAIGTDHLGPRGPETHAFPILPPTAEAMKEGWRDQADDVDKTMHHYTPLTDPDGAVDLWTFRDRPRNRMDRIYEASQTLTFQFDRNQGLVTRIESTHEQGYGVKSKGGGTTELVEVKEIGESKRRKLSVEAERYAEAVRTYQQAVELARNAKGSEEAQAIHDEAIEDLRSAREKLTIDVLWQAAEKVISEHPSVAASGLEGVKRRSEIIGQPFPDWTLNDLDGEEHRLKDYQGQVVVLDFWYRGCGWCCRAMPQLMQVAEHFEEEPVAVFGMNVDRKDADARFTAEAMGLNYPTLLTDFEFAKKGHVRGYPTLLVLDLDGRIFDVHYGYSPTLGANLVQTIGRMLPPTAE